MTRSPLEKALFWVLVTVSVLSLLFICVSALSPGVSGLEPAVPESVRPEILRSEETSDGDAGVRRIYRFTVPEHLDSDMSLVFYVEDQFTRVSIGGSELFLMAPSSDRGVFKTPGGYWVLVPMWQEMEGQAVEIVCTPVFPDAREPEIRISQMSAVMSQVMRQDLPLEFLSILSFCVGLLLLLIALLSSFEPRRRISLIHLGFLAILTGTWKLLRLPILTLLFALRGYSSMGLYMPRVLYIVSLTAYLLIPSAVLQFMNYQRDKANLGVNVCSFAAVVIAALVIFAQLTGLAQIHSFLPWLRIELVVLPLVSILLQLPKKPIQSWIFTFPIAAALDLVIYFRTGSSRMCVTFLLCILVNALIRGIYFMRETLQHGRELQNTKTAMLVSQIRPHFIHNTMASVYYLCDSDPQKAKKVILDFSSYLQKNFTNITKDTPIPFSEELVHTRAYLNVEMTRFEGKLFVTYDTAYSDFELPALTLQPIVENSVRYGVSRGVSPEHILIRTRAVPNGSEILVRDDGIGYNPTPDSRPHVGLKNIRERLSLLCNGTLSISRREEGGTDVVLFIPRVVDPHKEEIPWNEERPHS